MPVDDCGVLSSRENICAVGVEVEALMIAGTSVPALLNSTTQNLNGTLPDCEPSDAPAALVLIDRGDAVDTQIGPPLAIVASRNAHRIGLIADGVDPLLPLNVNTSVLAVTDAVIDRLLHASNPNGGLVVLTWR